MTVSKETKKTSVPVSADDNELVLSTQTPEDEVLLLDEQASEEFAEDAAPQVHVEETTRREMEDKLLDVIFGQEDVAVQEVSIAEGQEVSVESHEPEETTSEAAPLAEEASMREEAPVVSEEEVAEAVVEEIFIEPKPEWYTNYALFRAETQRLARGRDWSVLAALYSEALAEAQWAKGSESRIPLLVEQARLYAERLSSPEAAEEVFRNLLREDPAHREAIDFLLPRLRAKADHEALFSLLFAAVEASFDPSNRLDWTREAARIANSALHQPARAVEAWERLWKLGDADAEALDALNQAYRALQMWDKLAAFLEEQLTALEGSARVLLLRELTELHLSARNDPQAAHRFVTELLALAPKDKVASLALGRILVKSRDNKGLAALGKSLAANDDVSIELARMAAAALWENNECAASYEIYQALLAIFPEDREALAIKEKYLAQSEQFDALCRFLEERAEKESDTARRAKRLAEAAKIAQHSLNDLGRASVLLARAMQLIPASVDNYAQLTEMYELLGDLPSVARTLEAWLAATVGREARVGLLRRLGDHYAKRMSDDNAAERCWRELQRLRPRDEETERELLALLKRRNQFEELDAALTVQLWESRDADRALDKAREIAHNAEYSLQDMAGSQRAWQRVLDLAPNDAEAQAARQRYLEKTEQSKLLAALVDRSAAVEDRLVHALDSASRWEAVGERLLALAAYERALYLQGASETALAGVTRLRGSTEYGAASAAVEVALQRKDSRADKSTLLSSLRSLLPEGNSTLAFALERRLLWLAEEPDHKALASIAESSPELLGALVEAYTRLAVESQNSEQKLAYREAISSICSNTWKLTGRAFTEVAVGCLDAASVKALLSRLVPLANNAERYEDLLALYETQFASGTSAEEQREALVARASICEEKLGDKERAFGEWKRIFVLDPQNEETRVTLHRLAGEKKLWNALDALYAERMDASSSEEEKRALHQLRYQIQRNEQGDLVAALDLLCAEYRLTPNKEGILEELLVLAEQSQQWTRVLPMIEGATRGAETISVDRLVQLASLYEKHTTASMQAHALYQEALWRSPENDEVVQATERLARTLSQLEDFALTLRRAAALTTDTAHSVVLLQKAATIYETDLGSIDSAVDVHRRILARDPSMISSIDALVAVARTREQWAQLRSLLEAKTQLVGENENLSLLLEIASISREKLGDPEAAFASLAKLLSLSPKHPTAEESMRDLSASTNNKGLELRRLKLALSQNEGEAKPPILQQIAALQESEGNIEAAVEALEQALAETEYHVGCATELERLYRLLKNNKDLVKLLARKAKYTETDKLSILQEAIALQEKEGGDTLLLEELYYAALMADPSDALMRDRLSAAYYANSRFAELDALLASSPRETEVARRSAVLRTRASILRGLGRNTEADTLLAEAYRETSTPDLALQRAIFASTTEIESYIALRTEQSKPLPAQAAALVFCHIAEVLDEANEPALRISAFYRNARQLDPENSYASEGLKGIGRRNREWRKSAALLQDPKEREMSSLAKASQLVSLGDAAQSAEALSFYWRAVAVSPAAVTAWDALVRHAKQHDTPEEAYQLESLALAAYEAVHPLGTASLDAYVERLCSLSKTAARAGQKDEALQLAEKACRLLPESASAVLLFAEQSLAHEQYDTAMQLYERTLRLSAQLSAEQRLHTLYRRGSLARKQGNFALATDDLLQVLRESPLHTEALAEIADLLVLQKRYASAVQHHVQAMIVEEGRDGRAAHYESIGFLLEDHLGSPDEAGVCYERALSLVTPTRELQKRALKHYMRTKDEAKALAMITLLEQCTEDSSELASLWSSKGYLLRSSRPDEAIEAFDMALSYEPGQLDALSGLAALFEERGEWAQLVDLFEARLEEGTPEEKREALRQMARLSLEQLQDQPRAEQYLQKLLAQNPTRQELQQLLSIYGERDDRRNERLDLLARLVLAGPPYYSPAVDLAKQLLKDVNRRWAWSILSPMAQMAFPDPSVKGALQELRKEFEKKDYVAPISMTQIQQQTVLLDAGMQRALQIIESKGLLPLQKSTDEIKATAVLKVDERTAPGKIFRQVATIFGKNDVVLHRAQDLCASVVPVAALQHLYVRSDLVQSLSSGDLAFAFAYGLFLMSEGNLVFSASSTEAREKALGFLQELAGGKVPGETLQNALTEEERAACKEALAGGEPIAARFAKHEESVRETALRIGALAAGDFRLAGRAVSRMFEEDAPRTPSYTKVADLEEHLGTAPSLRKVLSFFCSRQYAATL